MSRKRAGVVSTFQVGYSVGVQEKPDKEYCSKRRDHKRLFSEPKLTSKEMYTVVVAASLITVWFEMRFFFFNFYGNYAQTFLSNARYAKLNQTINFPSASVL